MHTTYKEVMAMPDVTERPRDRNGHTPGTPARRSTHHSYATGEITTQVGYQELTDLMDAVYDLWDKTEDLSAAVGDGFEAIIGRIRDMREWTGWDGVPGIYTGGVTA